MHYACVDKAPDHVRKFEYVIEMPTFMEEIEANNSHKGSTTVTRNSHLRNIISAIGVKYALDVFNPYTDIKLNQYLGLPFSTSQDLSKIVVRIFHEQFPKMIDYYIAEKIKARPLGTKVVYFVGDFLNSHSFSVAGFAHIKPQDIDYVLGLKTKVKSVTTMSEDDTKK